MKNYRPISLLLIFGKLFWRVIFMDLFNSFHKNKLFTKCQSDFLPGDSYISQLLSIAHDINSSFDRMLGIKAFDNMWHKGLLFKLKTYSVKGELLSLPLLKLVVLNGQISSWELIKPEVPQGLSLVLLLFLIYINNLPDNIQFTCKIFANDASLFFTCFW